MFFEKFNNHKISSHYISNEVTSLKKQLKQSETSTQLRAVN